MLIAPEEPTSFIRSSDVYPGLLWIHKGHFFSSSTFHSTIKNLIATYDQVFICPKDNEAVVGLMALKDFDPAIVLLAGLRRTRKVDIKKVIANKPIDILFYD